MKLLTAIISFALAIPLFVAGLPPSLAEPLDFDVPHGHFFKQANGQSGAGDLGFAVVDDDAPFWSEFQRLGGVPALGYPISRRFEWDGFLVQAFQKAIFQWRPEVGQVYFVNIFDLLSAAGKDDWLEVVRATPPSFDNAADRGLPWDDVVKRHFALLDQNPAIRARYFADSDPILHFGLPMSDKDYGNVFVVRAQRAVFQQWKEDVAWAKAGEVVVANGGDVAREAGILPVGAGIPHRNERSHIVSLLAGPGPLYLLQLQWTPQSVTSASSESRDRLLTSDDLGKTWRPFAGDLPVAAACLTTVGMDYATRDTLYASTCQGIYRWTGTLWEKISSRQAGQLSVAVGNSQIIMAIVDDRDIGRVIQSLDGGQRWRDLNFPASAATIGTNPRNPRQTYALSEYKNWWFSLWRGTGEPGQWTQLPTPYGDTTFDASMTIDGGTGEIYLVVRDSSGVVQLWRSPNAGATDASTVRWERVYEFGKGASVRLMASGGGPAGLVLYGTLGYLPGGGMEGTWWGDAGDDPVLIRSLDGGQTWEGLVGP